MTFVEFASYLEKLEGVSSRLEITAILAELFQKLDPTEVTEACYLLQGQLLPPYEALELQIAVKTIIKALVKVLVNQGKILNESPGELADLFGEQTVTAATEQEKIIAGEYQKLGDLGAVAEKIIQQIQPQKQDTIQTVYARLVQLAKDTGADSQSRKLEALTALLESLQPISAKFVVRIILGRLRLGFSDMTIIDALSWAMTGGKGERDQLEEAYQRKADIGKLAAFYLQQIDIKKRLSALQNYSVEVGVPVIPALCQRLNSAAEMIEKMTEVIAEPKYDGLRVQIHINKQGKTWKYKTFTRSLEENSHQFPELAAALDSMDCDSCILDGEAIGYDPQTGDLLPFQDTMQRKRKHGISEKAKEVPIRFYVFDVLELNGQDLLNVPLSDRKEKLRQLFTDNQILYHSPEFRTTDSVALHDFHEQELANGLEGVVVKQISAGYQSGRKGWSWVKMKEAEGTTGKLADAIDAIVMGYYYGRGKRSEFGIGAILVGIMDEAQENVLTLAKIGTGLTDEVLRQTKLKCDELATPTAPPHYQVNKLLAPNVWCLPGLVVEVAADEITRSPIHTAGVALRFPRLVKFREDKTWQQATTLAEVRQLSSIKFS